VGGGYNPERHLGINTGARRIVNEEYGTRLTWGALKRAQSSGHRC
jgi:hypothetical protein